MTGLFNELQKPPAGWAHVIDDLWFIATQETAQQLADRIRPFFNNSDHFIVVKIGLNPHDIMTGQGMMPTMIWEWLNDPRNHR
jgi:hypothetical protein